MADTGGWKPPVRRGPDFLVVRDRRPTVEPADYTLSESEARIYLACEDGASVAEVCETLPAATQTEVSADDVPEEASS